MTFVMACFGLFWDSSATGAEEAMLGLGNSQPVLLIRNRGHLTVDLLSTSGDQFTASLRTAVAQASLLQNHVEQFVASVAVAAREKDSFQPYLRRLIMELLQHCHGTLLAVIAPTEGRDASLSDGVWLERPISLSEAHEGALKSRTAEDLSRLQGCEALLRGMIDGDGIVGFSSDGCILGYRIFLKPDVNEIRQTPNAGRWQTPDV